METLACLERQSKGTGSLPVAGTICFKTVNNMNRGSEWRQWDLHFHTPSSYDYEDMSVTNQDIIDGLLANNISAVAITDHHIIDIARIKELQAISANRITIFPGIEFLSDARGKDPIHFIAIFSDTADIDFIWGQIENRTNICRIKGEGKNINEVYCDLQETCKLVHELGGIITIHAGSKSNGIDKITNSLPHYEAMKDDISKVIDIYDMGKEEDLPGYRQYVFPSIGRVVPMVICSDNHNIKNYQRKQKLWIKADTSFDGLKQVLFEPDERVALCANKPDEKSIYNVIDYVTISEPGFCENTILFNQNLNTIIGGRSTGKSSLLNALAAKHNCPELNKQDYILQHVNNVNVGWADGNNTLNRDIEYFPQGYMHEIAKSSDKTNSLVERIIKNKDAGGLIEELHLIEQSNKKTISEGLFSIFNLYEELTKERKSLAEAGLKEGVIQQIKILTTKISELQKNSVLSVEENAVFKGLVDQIEEKKKQKENADKDIEMFSKIRSVSPIRPNFENETKLSLLSFGLNADEISRHFTNLRISTETSWTTIVDTFSSKTKDTKESLEKEISALTQNEIFKKGLAYYAGNKELKDLTDKLNIEKKKLVTIEQIESRIKSLRGQLNTLLATILQSHLSFKDSTQKVIDNLVINVDGLVIRVCRRFMSEKMRELLEGRLNMRGSARQEYINNIIGNYEGDTKSQIQKFILDIIKGNIELKGSNTALGVATDFLSSNWFSLDFELNYQGDSFEKMSEGKQAFVILKLLLEFSDKQCPILIDQPEDSLDNRAIYKDLVTYIKRKKKVRQIILVTHNSNVVVSADSENVIVANQNGIDSPNHGNNQFEYIYGSLENSMAKDTNIQYVLSSQGIREHVCDILEGGRAAFEKREQKYGFKS